MTETSKERRAHPRFAIQGATVSYLIHGPEVREPDFPISYPLMELSRGGMSFITESALKAESALSIFLSGLRIEETLRMTGRVVYCRASGIKPSRYCIGVEFRPFAKKRGCNTPESLEILKRLEKGYLQA